MMRLLAAICLAIASTAAQPSDPSMVSVGDFVCFEGFVMDEYCINEGFLIDSNGIVTLEQPGQHSVHCLIDVGLCRNSNYELLGDPDTNSTPPLYTRAFRVDENGKLGLQQLAAVTGAQNPPDAPTCTECTGDGDLARGFRAQVYGQVVALADGDVPPTIKIIDATASHDLEGTACESLEIPEQNPAFGPVETTGGIGVADPDTVSIGDEICFEGFIMDTYCIELGTLFDSGGSIVTLEQPDQHSVHCLIDVARCVETPFEILMDPDVDGELYSRGFRIEEFSKPGVIALAAAAGATNPTDGTPRCTECTGEGSLSRGFRAEVYGRVTALADGDIPPVIEIVDAVASNGIESVCSKETFPEQNPAFAPPAMGGVAPPAMGFSDPNAVMVGDEVCFEGFIMDVFCIDRGTLFDNNRITTLRDPQLHSVHCLIDVPQCRGSPYEILAEPETDGQLYSRAFRVDEAGKAGLQALAARTGATNPPNTPRCTECTGDGDLDRGFRAEVYGRVVELGSGDIPPTISIVDAFASNDIDTPLCARAEFPAQNSAFSASVETESSTSNVVERLFMAVAIIAIAGVGALSVFGDQIFPKKATYVTTDTKEMEVPVEKNDRPLEEDA